MLDVTEVLVEDSLQRSSTLIEFKVNLVAQDAILQHSKQSDRSAEQYNTNLFWPYLGGCLHMQLYNCNTHACILCINTYMIRKYTHVYIHVLYTIYR